MFLVVAEYYQVWAVNLFASSRPRTVLEAATDFLVEAKTAETLYTITPFE